VVEREPQDPDAVELGEPARALREALRTRLQVTASDVARVGELVVSVVVGEGDPLLLGLHRQSRGRSPYPGARFPIALPEAAPSRAYLKIEEAIRSFDLPMRAGDTALEIGAAPGGAAYALLQRGIRVFAVDPAAMDPRLLERAGPSGARVTHLQLAMRDLHRKELPGRIDWLLMDVHLAPQIALRAARRLASELRSSLCGAVLTMKLNDWSFAARIPDFVAQTLPMGLLEPRAKQLASHRQEVAIVGLTKLGLERRARAATRV
jgi:23S rRNA (cytidine2498-2'-O)-methyltransferase